jgi:tetratricopeptide (TPR) repeat protein
MPSITCGWAAAPRSSAQGGSHLLEGVRLLDEVWPHLDAAWRWLHARPEVEAAGWLDIFHSSMPGMLGQRLPLLEAAVAAAQRLGERAHEGLHLSAMGALYVELGDPQQATSCLEQALAIRRETGDRPGEGSDLWNLGNACQRQGDPKRAIARELGQRQAECTVLRSLGNAALGLGDLQRAVGHKDAEQDAQYLLEMRRRAGLADGQETAG